MKTNAIATAFAEPWAISPRVFGHVVETVAGGDAIQGDQPAARSGAEVAGVSGVVLVGSVAVVSVYGILRARASFIDQLFGGVTTYADVTATLYALAARPELSAIVLDLDTPGGTVNGVVELVDAIADVRASVPVHAYSSGSALSAGYWLASACETIGIERTAGVGSIGVVATIPKQVAADSGGWKLFEIVSSGADAKRPDPESDDGVAEIRREIDEIAGQFVADVAAGRGVSPGVVRAEFGAGGVLIGAAALSAGMVDMVGSFEDFVAGLQAESDGSQLQGASAGAAPMEGQDMDMNSLTIDQIQAARPDLIEAAIAGDRERVAAIVALGRSVAGEGVAAAIDAAIADPKATVDAVKATLFDLGAKPVAAAAPAPVVTDPKAPDQAALDRLAEGARVSGSASGSAEDGDPMIGDDVTAAGGAGGASHAEGSLEWCEAAIAAGAPIADGFRSATDLFHYVQKFGTKSRAA